MQIQISNDSKYRRRIAQLYDRLDYWDKVDEIPLNTKEDVKDALARLQSIVDKKLF